MLMNLNNFMGNIMPNTSTPTKEHNKQDYTDQSTDNSAIKSELLNAYGNALSPIASPTKSTADTNIWTKNDYIDFSGTGLKNSVESTSNDEGLNNSQNSSANNENAKLLEGYTLINNYEDLQHNELKIRLLSALADMIPHDESLSLRLLMSYTIDDQESECVVIDETLCRGKHDKENKQYTLHHSPSSNEILQTLGDQNRSELTTMSSQTSSSRITSFEADALDLSLHTETSDYHIDLFNRPTKKDCVSQLITTNNESSTSDSAKNRTTLSTDMHSMQQTLMSTNIGQFNLDTTTTGTGTTQINQIPLLDTSILALLPLLHQQQNQQQPSANILTYQHVLNSNSLPLLPAPIPISSTTVTTTKTSPLAFSYSGTSTNANLLFNQLYPTNTAQSQQNIHQTNSLLTTNLSSMISKHTETLTTSATTIVTTQNTATSSFISSIVNNHPLWNTASFIGFPLFNPFSTNTTTSSTYSSSNNDQFSAIQAHLTSASSFLGTAPTATPMHAQSSLTPVSNITSLNLGSTNTTATLLNLKDKQTGLIETIGIMPSMKNLNQPIASLINQLSVNSPNNCPTNISFKALSTLSQLFNNSIPTTTNSSDISSDSSNPKNTNLSIIKNHNGNITTATITSNNSNNNVLLGVGMTEDKESVLERNCTKISSNLRKTFNKFSPLNSSNGHSSVKLSSSSRLNLTPEQKNHTKCAMQSSIQQQHPTTNGNNFLFGRRLAHSRRFICNQCRRNFSSLAELNRHTIETHNSFRCTICSAHFTQRSNLQRHSLKHVGFKPFTCNLCKKEYYRKDHLVRHIEVTHPTHDPKMNITVHLTSSECLDYLDRLHAGKQTPSPPNNSQCDKDTNLNAIPDSTTSSNISSGTNIILPNAPTLVTGNNARSPTINKGNFELMNEESMKVEEAKLETLDIEMNSDSNENNMDNIEEESYNIAEVH